MKKYTFVNRGFNLKRLSRFLMTLGVGFLIFFNVETAQAQDIEITLTWTGGGTWVDLWVTDPNKNIYTWDVPGSGINGISPDTYTVDAGTAINGNYLVEVCYWTATPQESAPPIEATVVVILRKGTISEQSITYGPQTITETDDASAADPYHENPEAWWTITTISWPSGIAATGGSSSSEACFIATAAYSGESGKVSPEGQAYGALHRMVQGGAGRWESERGRSPITDYRSPITVLQRFRDEYLLTNKPGRAFVSYYERISPPVARYIEDKEVLKAIIRFYLKPVVWVAKKVTSNPSVTETLSN